MLLPKNYTQVDFLQSHASNFTNDYTSHELILGQQPNWCFTHSNSTQDLVGFLLQFCTRLYFHAPISWHFHYSRLTFHEPISLPAIIHISLPLIHKSIGCKNYKTQLNNLHVSNCKQHYLESEAFFFELGSTVFTTPCFLFNRTFFQFDCDVRTTHDPVEFYRNSTENSGVFRIETFSSFEVFDLLRTHLVGHGRI